MSEPLPPSAPDAPSGPGTQGSTSTLERHETRRQTQPGDNERYAHYVPKDRILASAMSGEPVIALCGKIWLPTRDPSRFPVCPACKEIYAGMHGGSGDSGGSDGSGGSGSGGQDA
ncbi:DUF3039 domain-containing protein [Serinibacter arcticus]|uniref:DUF3039 domain-containing protein n=1 Tax=Serinibacter arcticus TaxID=1655435 RepID=A0A2U1ZTC5_9MICO|nr:DUF3039 domain-containing protein [Serinibacter arcticus]PWD50200.1 DUF3039 domain-containing protein [Serinibacter arcticus]